MPTPFGEPTALPPRRSATLVLVRAGQHGPEVLLVRRADRGDQNSNTWVFPGGLVDAADATMGALCLGPELVPGGPAVEHFIAAVRETFEEAGLLCAVDARGQALGASVASIPADWRGEAGNASRDAACQAMVTLCQAHEWRLDLRRIRPIAHWITPLGLPKRFDTWFLLAHAPQGQAVRVDGSEIVDHRWVRPADLLVRNAAVPVIGPARAVAQALAAHADLETLDAWAAGLGPIAPIQPRLGRDAEGRLVPVQPSHPAYSEIGLLDQTGHAQARCVIVPGQAVALMPGLLRVADAAGRNTYLLQISGEAPDAARWAVIDPPLDAHARTVLLDCLDCLPGSLCVALLTQVTPGAVPLLRETLGVPVLTSDDSANAQTFRLRLTAHNASGAPTGCASIYDSPRQVLFSGSADPAPLNTADVAWFAPATGFLRAANIAV